MKAEAIRTGSLHYGYHSQPSSTSEILQAYGLGKLDDAAAEDVHKHLEDCPDCRHAVAEMPSDSFLGRLREAQAGSPPATSAADDPTDDPPTPGAFPMVADDTQSVAPENLNGSSLQRGTFVGYFGDYELQRVLGEGGMGIVYKASPPAQPQSSGGLEVAAALLLMAVLALLYAGQQTRLAGAKTLHADEQSRRTREQAEAKAKITDQTENLEAAAWVITGGHTTRGTWRIDTLLRANDAAWSLNKQNRAIKLNNLGFALYRVGQFQESILVLDEGIRLRNGG